MMEAWAQWCEPRAGSNRARRRQDLRVAVIRPLVGRPVAGAPLAFPHFAITPPDDFAGSRRARADPAALRKSAPPQRAAPRYLR